MKENENANRSQEKEYMKENENIWRIRFKKEHYTKNNEIILEYNMALALYIQMVNFIQVFHIIINYLLVLTS